MGASRIQLFNFAIFSSASLSGELSRLRLSSRRAFCADLLSLCGAGLGCRRSKETCTLKRIPLTSQPLLCKAATSSGCQLAQFCGDCGIRNGDAERAELQAQNLRLAGLRKIRRGNADKMALQGRQSLRFCE